MENKTHEHSKYTLQELGDSNYVVAQGEPDIRGWELKDQQGNTLGKIEELLCDPQARKVRYLIVSLRSTDSSPQEDQQVLLPIAMAQLHEAYDAVTIPSLLTQQIQALPPYEAGHVTKETEAKIYQVLAGDNQNQPTTPDYNQDPSNEQKHYGNRKAQNVIGFFKDAESARAASQELQAQSYPADSIEIALRNQPGLQNSYTPENYERFFYSLFSNREEADQYLNRMEESQALVVVHAFSPEKAATAATIFNGFRRSSSEPSSAPLDIEVEQVKSSDNQFTNTGQQGLDQESKPQNGFSQPQPSENRQHQAQSHILERSIEENVRLRGERVKIEQVPVNQPDPGQELQTFQAGTMELKEHAQVPVVNKKAHVVEEITLGKEVEIQEETIHETSRKTQVDIEEKHSKNPPN